MISVGLLILENNQIEYAINKVDFWFDLDIEHTDYSTLSEVDLECHKDSCQRFLHDIGEKRIYNFQIFIALIQQTIYTPH